MERTSRDSSLPVGNARRRRDFYPGVSNQDRDPQHSVVVHRRRARVFHGQNHTLCR
uniref:Uncharacterized protein n=1 Tax=Brassica oleracea TaxID=3712 RepID=A0A3P6BTS5_BRAOL|nr:unnamed protein product [Brassica oleracea]